MRGKKTTLQGVLPPARLATLDLFDRLRKYLARFDLDWARLQESPPAA